MTALWIFNSKKGFSLLEILIAVGIIGLLSAVAFPNLRGFLKQQEIDGTALEVLSALKIAQSSAQSRIKCPKDEVSDTWIVRLSDQDYSLISVCETSGEQFIFSNKPYTPSSADKVTRFNGSVDVCLNATTEIIFTKSQISYKCAGQVITDKVVKLTLSSSNSDLTKVVRIESGGILKVE